MKTDVILMPKEKAMVDRLLSVRDVAGVDHEQFRKTLRMTRMEYAALLEYRFHLMMVHLCRVAAGYGVTCDWLFGRSDDMHAYAFPLPSGFVPQTSGWWDD